MGLQITREQYNTIVKLIVADSDDKAAKELEASVTHEIDSFGFQRVLAYYTALGPQGVKMTQQNEVLDIITDEKSVRLTISGLEDISVYCKSGRVSGTAMKKTRVAQPVRIDEYGIQVKLSDETPLESVVEAANHVLSSRRKLFRMKRRTSFQLTENWRLDCTVVKSMSVERRDFALSAINNVVPRYELEIEYTGDFSDAQTVAKGILMHMSELLKVLEDVEYLTPNRKKTSVVKEYYAMVFPREQFDERRIKFNPKSMFIGPQPVSMQLYNLLPPEHSRYSVQVNYTVTHKADGERNLIYVDNNGAVYFLNNRMGVKATKLNCTSCKNSVFDAEVIVHNGIKRALVFDAYYFDGELIANLQLENADSKTAAESRMSYVRKFVKAAHLSNDPRHLITDKKFEVIGNKGDWAKKCAKLLDEKEAGRVDFNTDGLIFTPLLHAVGAAEPGKPSDFNTRTWKHVLKWKPPHDNTIDFLVKVRKIPGTMTELVQNDTKSGRYMTLDLYVRADISTQSAWNFFTKEGKQRASVPALFRPNGVDDYEAVSTMPVTIAGDGSMRCLNRDIIQNDTIVECSWDGKKWAPLRIRVDKTELYRKTRDIGGTANDRKTAESVWKTIVNPISERHVRGEIGVTPDMIIDDDDDEYYEYDRAADDSKDNRKGLRNFHNRWVKDRHLFGRLASLGVDSLVDFGCGQGGDLNRWVATRFKTVVGMDIASQNINHPTAGIYRRLAQIRNFDVSRYLFFTFDMSKALVKGNFGMIANEQERHLAMLAFGHDDKEQHPHVKHLKGIATDGFDVASSQFALHYFFKNEDTLNTFIDNVDRCLKPGGYFMGTCFDGEAVAEELGDKLTIAGKDHNNNTAWSIQRMYDPPFQKTQCGQKIKVFYQSIGKYHDEYLVDFKHLESMLATRGIRPLNAEELGMLKLQRSSGSFRGVFDDMLAYTRNTNLTEKEKWLEDAVNMTIDEQKFSFMNKWFIYRKAPATKAAEQKPKRRIVKRAT